MQRLHPARQRYRRAADLRQQRGGGAEKKVSGQKADDPELPFHLFPASKQYQGGSDGGRHVLPRDEHDGAARPESQAPDRIQCHHPQYLYPVLAGQLQKLYQKASVKTVSIWEWNCIAADKAAWAEIPWVQGERSHPQPEAVERQWGVLHLLRPGSQLHLPRNRTSFAVRWPLWYVSSKGMWDGSLTGEDILMDACQSSSATPPMRCSPITRRSPTAVSSAAPPIRSAGCRPSPMRSIPPPRQGHRRRRQRGKAKMGSVTAVQKERMEAQFQYWNNAKALV